jgi:hypothetical protein
MVDLELDVEEEETQRGIEPPAYWPSRDSKVEVEHLTCHYAPQVCLFPLSTFTKTDIISLNRFYEESRSKLGQRKRLGYVVVQDLGSRVSAPFSLVEGVT